MDYRQLGNSELQVSLTGLGGNTFGPPRIDEAMSVKCIHRALDLGVNFVDTSLSYGQGESEIFIGKALTGRRSEMLIATKFNTRNLGSDGVRARIISQCEESLRKLQTDHIDLYQHSMDPLVPVAELLRAIEELVKSGKVRYVGTVNYASWRLAQSVDVARLLGSAPFVSSQHNYNMMRCHVELEVLPMCAAYDVGFLPNATLAGGYLTDKYRKGEPAPAGSRGAAGSPMVKRTRSLQNEEVHDTLKGWAHDRGHTLGELALAWLAARPEVSSILTRVSTPEQVEANVTAVEWTLTPEEKDDVDKMCAWSETFERIEGSIRRPGEGD